MGINATLYQITLLQLERIMEDHELIDKWIFYEDEDPKVLIDGGIYLGRSLYGLNFLITGDHLGGKPPESYAIFGKHLLFEDDWGVHSCTYLMPDEVKQVWSALSKITKDDLLSQFDVDVMNSIPIYPSAGWEQSDVSYLYDLFKKLLAYYRDTVHRQNATIHLVH